MKPASHSIEYRVGEPMPGTKWVVRGKLGQGGMGIVLDVMKGRLIPGAMKVLHPSFAKMPQFAERFLEEVRVTAQLRHPNIVQVLDFDRLADGTPFMVMERLRGRTLRQALRETLERGKIWSAANAYAVAAQVCEGLSRAHSHARAIVHRDIKPENIFLHRPEGNLDSVVKVMDFGVAALVGQRDRNLIGTPRYMSPEQLSGGRVSPQTDQYAFALVIYEMLTGRLPWDVDVRDASVMAKVHLSVAPTRASKFCAWLPERIDAAILKALSKDPADRHGSVHLLVFELRGLQRHERSATGTDATSTDPSVGTLADGLPAVKEGPDTVAKISLSILEEEVDSAPGLTSGELVMGSSEAWWEALPGEEAKAAISGRGGDSGAIGREAEQNALAHDSPHGGETPMTGDSSDRSTPNGEGSRRLRQRKARLGLLAAACAVALPVAVVATTHAQRLWRPQQAPENRLEAASRIDPAGIHVWAPSSAAREPEPTGELGPLVAAPGPADLVTSKATENGGAPTAAMAFSPPLRTSATSFRPAGLPPRRTAPATATPSAARGLKPHYDEF